MKVSLPELWRVRATSQPAISIVNLASMRDQQNVDFRGLVVNAVKHTPVANPVAKFACEFAGEAFDIVVSTRILFQLCKASCQFAYEGLIRFGEERLSLGREDDIKHSIAPCANEFLCLKQSPFPRRPGDQKSAGDPETSHSRQATQAALGAADQPHFLFYDAIRLCSSQYPIPPFAAVQKNHIPRSRGSLQRRPGISPLFGHSGLLIGHFQHLSADERRVRRRRRCCSDCKNPRAD